MALEMLCFSTSADNSSHASGQDVPGSHSSGYAGMSSSRMEYGMIQENLQRFDERHGQQWSTTDDECSTKEYSAR
jgi:hypothetical protein